MPGADGILRDGEPAECPRPGRRSSRTTQSGRIYEALVTVSQNEYLGESRVATHELLHAIGFGHTGAWSSIMGPNAAGVDSPTVEDVAYAQLYYAIARAPAEREARFGIPESGKLARQSARSDERVGWRRAISSMI